LSQRVPPSFLTYLLVITFGIGSWVAVNGIWAEISVLVIVTPECSKFTALIVVIIQIANIGPILYAIAKYFFVRSKWKLHQFEFDSGVILILVGIGIASSILLSIFWNKNSYIFGSLHSVALLVVIFFLALVDCTSSVVFIPFMKYFPEIYLSGLYIGEGMSGILPTLFSLAQGSVKNGLSCNSTEYYEDYKLLGIRFSSTIYFLILTAMMVLCGLSFLSIILLPLVRRQMVYGMSTFEPNAVGCEESSDLSDSGGDFRLRRCCLEKSNKESSSSLVTPSSHQSNNFSVESHIIIQEPHFTLRKILTILYKEAVLYLCLGLLSLLSNGALSAVSPYAFLPYGNSVYHISVNLSLLATPLMFILFLIFPSKSKVVSVMITAIAIILGIYIIDIAVMYPKPLLINSVMGAILIVSYILT